MSRPVLLKLGGSLVTQKAKPGTFQRGVAGRLLQETAKAGIPVVLLHGAGSFGHPAVARSGLGNGPLDAHRREAASEVLAGLAQLEGHMLTAAHGAGLRPVPVPLHISVQDTGEALDGLPIEEVRALLDDGMTPVLHGTLVRHARTGWCVLGADRILAELAAHLDPRLCLWATDVDGAYDGDPKAHPTAKLLPKVSPATMPEGRQGTGADVTGRMHGKLEHAFAAAQFAPTLIVNGMVRGRVLDALRGKAVVGTRVEAG
ncbi:MAG: isopentenyl phosphate kinase [Thermoplasmata archaeon]|jgi:isopentenyl phosphate kinase|nr:isopentenyl phosphate kinase [Thermoplasmata archaeon]